jgi:hypothetical protein
VRGARRGPYDGRALGRPWSVNSFRAYWTARVVTSIVRGVIYGKAMRARALRMPGSRSLRRSLKKGMPRAAAATPSPSGIFG